jgi:hypothetical protein
MSLAAFSYAVALATPAALIFALLLMATHWLSPRLPRRRAFLASIANAPAERLWRQQHSFGRKRTQVLMPILVFIITATLLTIAEPVPPALLQNRGLQIAILASSLLLAIVALAHATRLTALRHRQRLRIDANLAIAQSLHKLSGNRNRTFHDVQTAYGALDHVVAGLHGVYAVSVIARQTSRRSDKQLHVDGETITFGGRGSAVAMPSLQKRVLQFSRDCSKLLQQDIQVRHVIAVPGWEVAAQANDRLLIANERNVAMLTGWKDERAYLMDEDVDALHQYLDQRCSRTL